MEATVPKDTKPATHSRRTPPANTITCYCGALLYFRADWIHKVTSPGCPGCGAPRPGADLPPLPFPLPYPRMCAQCGGELEPYQLIYCTKCDAKRGQPVRRFVLPRERR